MPTLLFLSFHFSTVLLLATSPLAYQIDRLPRDPAKQRVGRVTRGLRGLRLRMGFGGAVELYSTITLCVSGVGRQVFMLVLSTTTEL